MFDMEYTVLSAQKYWLLTEWYKYYQYEKYIFAYID